MTTYYPLEAYDEAAEYIHLQTAHRPKIALVLGSGLSGLAGAVEHATILPYNEIPHFPISTVPGHAGRLVVGELSGVPVCVMQGRFHFYEGYSLQQVTFPIRVMQRMGIGTLILTNAAGGVSANLRVGDLMLIEDHINFVGMAGLNPLTGPNMEQFGHRFPAANHIYTKSLRDVARQTGEELGIELRRGVYTFLAGPNFETAAEVRMLGILGADAVGMSTVPEALVGHHAGMDVLAISTITNICIDQLDAVAEPTHEETQASGEAVVPKLSHLLVAIVMQIGA